MILKKGHYIYFFSDLDDECRDMMCGGSCQYNYGYNEFACTCPENTYLNDDGSSCVLFDSAGKFDFSSLLLTWYLRTFSEGNPRVVGRRPLSNFGSWLLLLMI